MSLNQINQHSSRSDFEDTTQTTHAAMTILHSLATLHFPSCCPLRVLLFTLSTIRLEILHSCTRLDSSHSFALANVAHHLLLPQIPTLYVKNHMSQHIRVTEVHSDPKIQPKDKLLLKECIQKSKQEKAYTFGSKISTSAEKYLQMQLISERTFQSSRP